MDSIAKFILDKFPTRNLHLPLQGYRSDWPYHVTMCNTTLKDVWNRLTYYNMISAFSVMYKVNAMAAVVPLLGSSVKELFSLNFFGLNTMRYQGFTEYKDNRLSSYTDQLKYVLNPSEFVLWDEPVLSMTDGTVVELYNETNDMINRGSLNSRVFIGDNLNIMYGNHVAIETDNFIRVYYCGLRRNSFLKLKEGDRVTVGQKIGNVGCCGTAGKRPYLHIEFAFNVVKNTGIKAIDDARLIQVPIPAVNMEAFYEMPLWTDYRDSAEGVERMYVKDIKYIFNPGHFLRAGSLIKRTANK